MSDGDGIVEDESFKRHKLNQNLWETSKWTVPAFDLDAYISDSRIPNFFRLWLWKFIRLNSSPEVLSIQTRSSYENLQYER